MDGDETPLTHQQEIARKQGLVRRFDFGLRVMQFLDSDIGKQMLADSSAEKDLIKDALVAIDGDSDEGRKEERDLRLRFAVVNQWQVFFNEYIKAGEDAEAELRQSETMGNDEEGEQ